MTAMDTPDLDELNGHTPGPWRAEIGEDQPSPMYIGVICMTGQMHISVVTDGRSARPDEWEANARLIAAAPSLLSAARENEKLKAALRPFARYAKALDSNCVTAGYPDACPLMLRPDRPNDMGCTVGDLRRARAALGEKSDD